MNIILMPSWFPRYAQTGEDPGDPIHGIFILDQVRLLQKKGNNVTVFLPTMVQFLRLDKLRFFVKRKEEYTEVRFRFPKIFPKFKYGYFLSFNIGCIIGYLIVRYFIVKNKIDLIHAHVLFLSGYSAGVLKKIFKIPFILTEHTNPFVISDDIHHKLAAKTFRRTDALITVSEDLMRKIEEYKFEIPKKYIVGSVVDTSFFTLKPEGNVKGIHKQIFLNISMIHKYKGLIYLLKACKILVEQGVFNFEVWIVGEGPEKESLLKFRDENRLTDYVKFIGVLKREQLNEYFSKTDTFVFPSLHETFGLVVAEAMACGIPAIATMNGGSETIITKDTGILIDARDEFQLAEAMRKRIANEISFDKNVIRKHIIDNWGIESTIKKYERIWKETRIIV